MSCFTIAAVASPDHFSSTPRDGEGNLLLLFTIVALFGGYVLAHCTWGLANAVDDCNDSDDEESGLREPLNR